jgi:hypothetical protein
MVYHADEARAKLTPFRELVNNLLTGSKEDSFWHGLLVSTEALMDESVSSTPGAVKPPSYKPFEDKKHLKLMVPATVRKAVKLITERQADYVRGHYATMLMATLSAPAAYDLDLSLFPDIGVFVNAVRPACLARISKQMCMLSVLEKHGEGIGKFRDIYKRSEDDDEETDFEILEGYVVFDS